MAQTPEQALASAANAWARVGLTGDNSAKSPSDIQLSPITKSVTARILQANPKAQGLTEQDDLDALAEAIGLEVAARYVMTPAGARFAGAVVTTKVGPVSRQRKQPDPAAASAVLIGQSQAALRRISTIRACIRPVELFRTIRSPHAHYLGHGNEMVRANGAIAVVVVESEVTEPEGCE